MGKYASFWLKSLKSIQKQRIFDQPANLEFDISEISEIGSRDKSGYNGYLHSWIGQIEDLKNSAVFRDLRDIIIEDKRYRDKFPGQLQFRIENNSSLYVNYSPITYEILIERYRKIIDKEKSLSGEKYKWQLINEFHENWIKYSEKNQTFQEFIHNINFGNLIYELAFAVLRHTNKEAPVELEKLLLNLFDELKPIRGRTNTYLEDYQKIYFQLPDCGKSTFQDERTIATLLTFRYPDRYTFFKDSFYTKYCKGIGQKPKPPGEKIFHYYEIIQDFVNTALPRYPDLIEWKRKELDNTCYGDENNLILAQDIFYRTLDFKSENHSESENDVNENSEFMKDSVMNIPLNQILYGPPGTGKTYFTINHALSIIEGKRVKEIDSEKRFEVKKRFDSYLNSGQIDFITFHQSLSYEDFIEGIKPESPEDEVTTLRYAIEEGVFKRIANSAKEAIKMKSEIGSSNPIIDKQLLENAQFFKVSLGDTQNPDDDEIYQYCIKNNCISIGWGGKIDFSETQTEQEVKKIFEKTYTDFNPRDFRIFAIKCLKFGMKQNDIVFVSNGNYKLRAIGKIDGDYYFDENTGIKYNQFRKVSWLFKDLDIPVNEVYSSNFSQQSIYYLYNSKVKKDYFLTDSITMGDESKKYVLIIDEINRGNIVNIFGELITLIEPDKRWGNKEQLEITLPYSKEKFSVPPNLFIIGTMNTADRSVEALDTALRRRFSFIEMNPTYNLKDLELEIIDGVPLAGLLRKMNSRIKKLLDKDHLIGHSYLLNINTISDLKFVFKDRIIPLLQEYFYGDIGKLALVLDVGFFQPVDTKKQDKVLAQVEWYDSGEDLEERLVIHLKNLEEMEDAEFEGAIRILMKGSKDVSETE